MSITVGQVAGDGSDEEAGGASWEILPVDVGAGEGSWAGLAFMPGHLNTVHSADLTPLPRTYRTDSSRSPLAPLLKQHSENKRVSLKMVFCTCEQDRSHASHLFPE